MIPLKAIPHGDAVICALYDGSLCRIEADGSGTFHGNPEYWKKTRRIVRHRPDSKKHPFLKNSASRKGEFRMVAEWDFSMGSKERAISVMREMNDMLQTPSWSNQ